MKKNIVATAIFLLLTSSANAAPVDDLNQAISLIKSGRESEAQEILRNIIKLEATDDVKSAAYYMLAAREKDKNSALTLATRAIDLDKTAARNYEMKGSILYDLKRYEESIAMLTKAIELNPIDDRLYSMRGMAFRDGGNFEKAFLDLGKAVEMSPKNGLYRMRLGKAYFLNKKYAEAIAELERAADTIQRQDQAAECLLMVADSYFATNDTAKAQQLYTAAYKYTTDQDTRKYIQTRLKSFEELKKWNY
ncbi:tetratricopeptide repeat protein [Nitratidesulfovibrio liaohensis]|uniref:Tetratricopeptide repeat protein n=1 Tax=Nitratidesulfovibrio liaohensis TaxID=2604158 RepID=A0ABY9R1X5_9BACT|nr:tetratricopeptide repeat protein [Nitratidesulfovibrio liaohensis]WMW65750.1 tetratricopeptide repeat protein [Nitratidesulfovibrio liaohensis]